MVGKHPYYQNTYDFKGEEEDVQPTGVGEQSYANEEVAVNGEAPLNGKLNGQRVNGEATLEPKKSKMRMVSVRLVQFRLTKSKKKVIFDN